MSYKQIGYGAYWRPGELEACQKYFGEESETPDVLFIRNNTEMLDGMMVKHISDMEGVIRSNMMVNPMTSFRYTNCKLACFDQWQNCSIDCPKSFTFENEKDFAEKNTFDFPYMLRLNDRATGECTYLVRDEKELQENLPKIVNDYNTHKKFSTKMFCVEFIDTRKEGKYTSYRITVAGNKVISGYARFSDDWLAITKNFTLDAKEVFIRENKRIQERMKENESDIIRAVYVLGLHHVGMDVILDQNDKMYFIEVQPFYFAGNTARTSPPFWNPYKPQVLVDWLVQDKEELYKEIPKYYDNWLDKNNHFDMCYKSLKELYNVRTESYASSK